APTAPTGRSSRRRSVGCSPTPPRADVDAGALRLAEAAIMATAPTIAALASWRQSRGAKREAAAARKEAAEANDAVNHRDPGEPRLVEQVTEMRADLGDMRADVGHLKADVRHLKADVRDLKERRRG